jgi:hypothetical protein
MKIGTFAQAMLRFCHRNLKGCNVGITDGKGFIKYAVEIAACGVICIITFKNISTGAQAILTFSLSNLRDCNVGITDWGIYEVRS